MKKLKVKFIRQLTICWLIFFFVNVSYTSASENIPTEEEVAKIYVATFNRAPDTDGLSYWTNASGLRLSQIAQSFFEQSETQTLYPTSTSNRSFINSVYQNLFNRVPDNEGWNYWENQLNKGSISKNRFIEAVINGAQNTSTSNDARILNNKTEVGIYFSNQGLSNLDEAQRVMKGITDSFLTVAFIKDRILNNTLETNIWSLYGTETETTGVLELGRTKDASVQISALDGHILMTLNRSEDNGIIRIDTVQLKQEVQSYDSTIKLVKIISMGGIDTDPNDDGITIDSEQKVVNGSISAIIPLEIIYKTNAYRINFITTAISSILADKINITEENIIHISKELGVEDINNDNTITMYDLYYYDMVENESKAESYLRTNYLDNIHNNDVKKLTTFVSNMKNTKSFIKPIITLNNSVLKVKFENLPRDGYIRYSLKEGENDLNYINYYNEEINVPENNVLYFQECTLDNICYKKQKVLFDGVDYFIDYLNYEKPSELFTNRDELLALQNNVINTKRGLTIINLEIEKLENQLIELENKEFAY